MLSVSFCISRIREGPQETSVGKERKQHSQLLLGWHSAQKHFFAKTQESQGISGKDSTLPSLKSFTDIGQTIQTKISKKKLEGFRQQHKYYTFALRQVYPREYGALKTLPKFPPGPRPLLSNYKAMVILLLQKLKHVFLHSQFTIWVSITTPLCAKTYKIWCQKGTWDIIRYSHLISQM